MFKQTLLAGAVLAVSQAASAAFVIDNFNLPDPGAQVACDRRGTAVCTDDAQSSQFMSPTPGNIFGNYRELYMSAPGGLGGTSYDARVELGTLQVSTPNAQSGASATDIWTSIVRWDGAAVGSFASDGAPSLTSPTDTFGIARAGIGATDFTDGLTNIGFAATINSSDGPFSFELQVFSGANNWTSLVLGATEVGNCNGQLPPACFPGPFTLNINFSQFATLSGFNVLGGVKVGDGVNFGAVTAAQIIFRGTESVDFTMDMIQAVPEPTSLALVGLGLLGAGLARRRMTKA